MREISPIIAVDDHVLAEGREFRLRKFEDRSIEILMHMRPIKIVIRPPKEDGLIYPGSDKPRFTINDHDILPSSFTMMSHMKGQYPGVTIRFFGGLPIKMLQIIPRMVDERVEIIKRQKKDYDEQLRRGKFDMDYFSEYGIGQEKETEEN